MNLVLNYASRIFIRQYYMLILLIGTGIIGGTVAFSFSYISASNVLIGMCLFPFVLFINGKPRFNYFYFSGIILFALAAYIYHLRISYFLALSFYFIFLLELSLGRINLLVLFLIVLMSPVFLQIAVILGFPIRLYLSQWAGDILRLAGSNIQVEGNLMLMNGFGFAVDEACMGLNMLAISMLMGVFSLAHHYRVSGMKLSLKPLLIFFLAVFVLNVFSNLLRIIVLVVFRILPGNALHEIIGILCLVLYVMVPLYFLGRYMVCNFGKVFQVGTTGRSLIPGMKPMLVALGMAVMVVGFTINPGKAASEISYADVKLEGMKLMKIDGGITKMFNDELLVYVKPIPEFFSGEHTPLMCWKGSGYQFKSIRKEHISNNFIYCGVLSKGDELLHTAWWYTNGEINTINQLTWRSMMMKGHGRFCLINVTAKNERVLRQHLTRIIENNMLTINNP